MGICGRVSLSTAFLFNSFIISEKIIIKTNFFKIGQDPKVYQELSVLDDVKHKITNDDGMNEMVLQSTI